MRNSTDTHVLLKASGKIEQLIPIFLPQQLANLKQEY
jgi:hypothetical protein